MAIARNGGISYHDLAAIDIFEFFVILNDLEDSLERQSKKASK